jgi:hypothetical protein
MNRLLHVAGAALLAAVIAAPAAAQSTTFVLSSGERVSGELVDMGASGISARVNGTPRNFRLGDVAVIDFTGAGSFPSNEVDQVGGDHVLVLRDGTVLKGRLTDVGGASPRRISFSTGGSTRDFTSNNVARIYLARPNGSAMTSGGTSTANLAGASGTIRVPANAGWVSTGITVARGQTIQISSNGEVRLSTDNEDVATTAGSKKGRMAGNSPLPGALAGALIGRVGNGQPFGIGNQASFSAPASGLLYLAVNDDQLGDNAGEFGVTITPIGNPRR